jgi:ComF family protein
MTVTLLKPLGHLTRQIFNFLLPPRCLCCTTLVEEPQSLCNTCWKKLNFISPPFCESCSFPFEIDITAGTICGRCARHPALYNKVRVALRYDDGSKPLILRFKHSDATYLTPLLGKWMRSAGQDLIDKADYMVPVPLHWSRLLKRRYNQAALLALELAKHSRKNVAVDLLQRTRATPPQGYKKAISRKQNVANAFAVKPYWEPLLKDKTVLLIDDVLTSGATVQSCTLTLLKAGAREVNVLTLARIV